MITNVGAAEDGSVPKVLAVLSLTCIAWVCEWM